MAEEQSLQLAKLEPPPTGWVCAMHHCSVSNSLQYTVYYTIDALNTACSEEKHGGNSCQCCFQLLLLRPTNSVAWGEQILKVAESTVNEMMLKEMLKTEKKSVRG